MKTVIAHHWLTGMRGGERVLEVLAGLFPESPVYTLIHRPEKLPASLASRQLVQSWLGKLPGSHRYYRQALPLHPAAIHSLTIPDDTGLLISSDASLIKGIRTPSGCTHLCYCHSPPRYLWEMPETYLQSSSHRGWINRIGFDLFQKSLKQFDYDSAQKVDFFAANSHFTRERIRRFYKRESEVIHPPVDTDFFQPDPSVKRGNTFLVVSSLVPYKRVDLSVAVCNQLQLPLIIIGDGPERTYLEKLAGPTIRFLGRQPDDVIRTHYQQCCALLFPTLEDFGIVPVEAQACGCPVIAFAQGGALESIVAGESGLFFKEQSLDGLATALKDFIGSDLPLNPEACRSSALRFSKTIFRENLSSLLRKIQAKV